MIKTKQQGWVVEWFLQHLDHLPLCSSCDHNDLFFSFSGGDLKKWI